MCFEILGIGSQIKFLSFRKNWSCWWAQFLHIFLHIFLTLFCAFLLVRLACSLISCTNISPTIHEVFSPTEQHRIWDNILEAISRHILQDPSLSQFLPHPAQFWLFIRMHWNPSNFFQFMLLPLCSNGCLFFCCFPWDCLSRRSNPAHGQTKGLLRKAG